MNPFSVWLQGFLPNMPLEVFEGWIAPLAEDHVDSGLSFTERIRSKPWINYLKHRDIEFWRGVRWSEKAFSHRELPLDEDAFKCADVLFNAFDRYKLTGEWSSNLIANSPARIESVLDFMHSKRTMPGFLVCLQGAEHMTLVDGFHRLASLQIISPAINTPIKVWVAEESA
jgi:hypothetical protein